MNLAALRTEVLNNGFDPNVFTSRINMYLNDGMNELARKVDYYGDNVELQWATWVGGNTTPLDPATFARVQSVHDLDRRVELQYVSLADIDRSPDVQGAPAYYTFLRNNIQVYPSPDGVYNLRVRFWEMPTPMVADADVPFMPPDYHSMLIQYALYRCYAGEDDLQTAQAYQQQWQRAVASFAVDQRFPSSAEPTQVRGMWESEPVLGYSPPYDY